MSFCMQCGAQLPESGPSFCGSCGHAVQARAVQPPLAPQTQLNAQTPTATLAYSEQAQDDRRGARQGRKRLALVLQIFGAILIFAFGIPAAIGTSNIWLFVFLVAMVFLGSALLGIGYKIYRDSI